MKCKDCQNLILEGFGLADLPEDCREHLKSCPTCRAYQEELAPLTHRLGDTSLFALTEAESDRFMAKLSTKLDRPAVTDIRPRFPVRHLAVAAALLLIVGAGVISLWYNAGSERSDALALFDKVPVSDSLLAVAVGAPADTVDLSDRDVQILLSDFSQNHGVAAVETLLNDLSEDEMSYLKKNLKMGDIL